MLWERWISYSYSSSCPPGEVQSLLVAVPSFDLRHSCVLVNLDKLECHEVLFSSSLSPPHPNPQLEQLLNEHRASQSVSASAGEEEEGATLMQDLMGDSDDDLDM